ncbi:hypothetical protein E1A91_A02G083600v1 [Gossypium mustelinum]|uniref:YbaK/aminoacyl-tRNA synthetase-associated domain-containing protein n=2 Tax=Gossypium TaxID=3633 RepID=A0A5D3A8C6_GOSMU|nr:hypothetical protein ES332_A02G091100v1 [Gossypium tomentosum]TYJ45846.1 hypothetical protein E1A91_A02G083600v1 [Gossypium mustelinum]
MGYSKDQLLARLKELQIDFSQYEHPVVLTVEAQAKYVGNVGGALSKNLFLKDKKHRYYVVSALADTKVDMKVLSQRLGLGKGGLRMAPEEALGEILKVPLGCVTPFALVNESASHVSLLLDKGFKTQERCIFHPLSNDMSISKADKPSSAVQNVKEKSVNGVRPSIPSTDAGKFVEELLDRTSTLLLSEISEDSIKRHGGQLGAEVANNIRKCLREDLKNLATIVKNTAYTEGFYAGTHYQPKRL